MKKNCFNCKHFQSGDPSTSPSEDAYAEGNYCHKQSDKNEENIDLDSYLRRYKRCFE